MQSDPTLDLEWRALQDRPNWRTAPFSALH